MVKISLNDEMNKLKIEKAREHSESIRRARKLARKRAMREGLIPMKKSSDERKSY